MRLKYKINLDCLIVDYGLKNSEVGEKRKFRAEKYEILKYDNESSSNLISYFVTQRRFVDLSLAIITLKVC